MADQKYPAAGATSQIVDSAEGASNVTDEKKTEEEKKSFFGTLMEEAEKVGKGITKQLSTAYTKINETFDKNITSAVLEQCKSGNVIQLISRVTSKTVQVVTGPNDEMVLNADGPLETSAINTLWTVINEGQNQVRLHNSNNYIAVIEGQVVVKNYPPGITHSLETKFQLSQTLLKYVTLESLLEKHRFVEFMPTGQLKPALGSSNGPDAQFEVKLVSSDYPEAAQ